MSFNSNSRTADSRPAGGILPGPDLERRRALLFALSLPALFWLPRPVRANTEGVNPKGALIGPGGARVRAVMENLGPEKIDIVDWSADPAKFVAAALSPAVATGVQVISEKNQTAIAFIHDDQLSLAIGKEGQNARLAAKLTGWKIGIESAEAHAKKMAEAQASTSGETAE